MKGNRKFNKYDGSKDVERKGDFVVLVKKINQHVAS